LQKKVTATVLAENLVLINQVARVQVNNKSGTIWRADHAFSALFKKELSGWKIIHEHESSGNWEQVIDTIDVIIEKPGT
jgi:ketosteroid isomerase-like protein